MSEYFYIFPSGQSGETADGGGGVVPTPARGWAIKRPPLPTGGGLGSLTAADDGRAQGMGGETCCRNGVISTLEGTSRHTEPHGGGETLKNIAIAKKKQNRCHWSSKKITTLSLPDRPESATTRGKKTLDPADDLVENLGPMVGPAGESKHRHDGEKWVTK